MRLTVGALTRVDSIVRVDKRTGEAVPSRRVPMGGGLTMVEAAAGCPPTKALCSVSTWVAGLQGGQVVRVPLDGTKPTVIPTGLGSHTFAVTEDAVWVTNYEAGTISRIDPRTNAVRTLEEVGSGIGITAGGGFVWSSDSMGIAKIDPATMAIVDHLPVAPGSYYELVWDDGVIWASTRGSEVLKIDASP